MDYVSSDEERASRGFNGADIGGAILFTLAIAAIVFGIHFGGTCAFPGPPLETFRVSMVTQSGRPAWSCYVESHGRPKTVLHIGGQTSICDPSDGSNWKGTIVAPVGWLIITERVSGRIEDYK